MINRLLLRLRSILRMRPFVCVHTDFLNGGKTKKRIVWLSKDDPVYRYLKGSNGKKEINHD